MTTERNQVRIGDEIEVFDANGNSVCKGWIEMGVGAARFVSQIDPRYSFIYARTTLIKMGEVIELDEDYWVRDADTGHLVQISANAGSMIEKVEREAV